MVVLDEEKYLNLPPPPPYPLTRPTSSTNLNLQARLYPTGVPSTSSSFENQRPSRLGTVYRTLTALPAHILLQIVNDCLVIPIGLVGWAGAEERGRWVNRVMWWIAMDARRVSRGMYFASMHILRSAYIPSYTRHVQPHFSSDPFPHLPHDSENWQTESGVAPLFSTRHETKILDLYILLSLHESVHMDDSDLHTTREDAFKDLFVYMQPRARLEDLVCDIGVRAGLVQIRGINPSGNLIPHTALSVSITPSSADLSVTVVLPPASSSSSSSAISRKKKVASVPRSRGEPLEKTAIRMAQELQRWVQGRVR